MGSINALHEVEAKFKEDFDAVVKNYGLEDLEGRAEAVCKRVFAGFEGSGPIARLTVEPIVLASLTKEESVFCAPLLDELKRTVFREVDQIFGKVIEARVHAEHAKLQDECLQGLRCLDDSRKN